MKNFSFRSKIIAYGLMVVFAAAAAPIIVEASCPSVLVQCSDGRVKTCSGTSDGQGNCKYKESCLSCSGSEVALEAESVS